MRNDGTFVPAGYTSENTTEHTIQYGNIVNSFTVNTNTRTNGTTA